MSRAVRGNKSSATLVIRHQWFSMQMQVHCRKKGNGKDLKYCFWTRLQMLTVHSCWASGLNERIRLMNDVSFMWTSVTGTDTCQPDCCLHIQDLSYEWLWICRCLWTPAEQNPFCATHHVLSNAPTANSFIKQSLESDRLVDMVTYIPHYLWLHENIGSSTDANHGVQEATRHCPWSLVSQSCRSQSEVQNNPTETC